MPERPDPRLEELLERYVTGFARGKSDPDPVLELVEGEDRRQLGRMIDQFLETGPRPDPALFPVDDPRVTMMTAKLMPDLNGQAGGLASLLARRRNALDLTQAAVVESLVDDLGASPQEAGKVDAYYHDLEWGSLPATGLTDRVLDSLAAVLKTTRDALIEAGRSLGPGRASSAGPVYARAVDSAGIAAEMASPGPEASPPAGSGRRASPPDRIDQLFTGG